MDAFLDGVPWGSLTPSGLLLLVVLLILNGRLITRRQHQDVIADRDYWRKAAEERSAQLNALLPSVDLSTRMIEAIVRVNDPDGADRK